MTLCVYVCVCVSMCERGRGEGGIWFEILEFIHPVGDIGELATCPYKIISSLSCSPNTNTKHNNDDDDNDSILLDIYNILETETIALHLLTHLFLTVSL